MALDVNDPASFPWRLRSVEAAVEKLEDGKPEVVAEQVRQLREDFRWFRNIVYGFMASVGAAFIIQFFAGGAS